MAVIDSSGVGIAKGSLGNITYRTVNGRTIAVSRITKNKSNTPKQAARRNGFGETVRLGGFMKEVIEIGFDKVKNGTKRNNFVSSNTDLRNYLSDPEVEVSKEAPVANIYNALTDERFTGQIMAAKGTISAQSEFWETEDGELEGTISLSRKLEAGDTVAVPVCYIYSKNELGFSYVKVYSVTVGSALIKSLEEKNRFPVNKKTIPELAKFKDISQDAGHVGAAATGIVHNQAERSTAYFSVVNKETV